MSKKAARKFDQKKYQGSSNYRNPQPIFYLSRGSGNRIKVGRLPFAGLINEGNNKTKKLIKPGW